MSSNKKKASGKSYLKIIGCMLTGGLIGAFLGTVSSIGHQAVSDGTRAAIQWLGAHCVLFLYVLLAVAAVYGLLLYYHMRTIGKRMQEAEDEEADRWEYALNRNFSIFMIVNWCVILISFFLLTLSTDAAWGNTGGGSRSIPIVIPFILGMFIQCALQIRMVRLLQTLDPMKKGDPGDISFSKDWLASCDEAEREIIYQSSYQAYRVMSTAILALLVAAMLCHMMWNTGLFAVVVLIVLGIVQVVVFHVHSLRLQKKKLRG